MSAYNAERERCAKIIAEEFKGVEALQPSFTLADSNKILKRLTSTLKDLHNPPNQDDSMAHILLRTPKEHMVV